MPMTVDEMRDLAFPLQWPAGTPRNKRQIESSFRVAPFGQERDALLAELRRLGATHVVISSNLALRGDGLPYANRHPGTDHGVAVYFYYEKAQHAMACDKWRKIEHNIRALTKTIEAIRGIARWGSTDMMKRAFQAFRALPPAAVDWRLVLGVPHGATLEDARRAYHQLLESAHPDRPGGSQEQTVKLNEAFQHAKTELGGNSKPAIELPR